MKYIVSCRHMTILEVIASMWVFIISHVTNKNKTIVELRHTIIISELKTMGRPVAIFQSTLMHDQTNLQYILNGEVNGTLLIFNQQPTNSNPYVF